MRWLLHYSKTFISSYNVLFQGAGTSDVARDTALCRIVQRSVESRNRNYVLVKKPVRRFLPALQLVEKINVDVVSGDSANTRRGLRGTHLDNVMLCSAAKSDRLMYVKAAVAHTKGRKQNFLFNSHAFNFDAASFL